MSGVQNSTEEEEVKKEWCDGWMNTQRCGKVASQPWGWDHSRPSHSLCAFLLFHLEVPDCDPYPNKLGTDPETSTGERSSKDLI